MAKRNLGLVYKYSSDAQGAANHLTSITSKRIGRPLSRGTIPENKQIGDPTFLVSRPSATSEYYDLTYGVWLGIDFTNSDPWKDGNKYEVTEIWEPIKTIRVHKDNLSDRLNNGTYNDNGRNIERWFKLMFP